MSPLKVLVFDLDDTLLNTSETLLPAAQRESWSALKMAGVELPWEEFLKRWRRASRLKEPGKDLIETFVGEIKDPVGRPLSPERLKTITEALHQAFYGRRVKESLVLFEGARKTLEQLAPHFVLHLLTAGFLGTQRQKVQGLQIESQFQAIHYCDIERGEKKEHYFEKILADSSYAPEQHMSVGNRRDTDIGPAKKLGLKTCLMLRGEHLHQRPASENEIPDFEIEDIRDLISLCQKLAPVSL